jgi:hypothetical protein
MHVLSLGLKLYTAMVPLSITVAVLVVLLLIIQLSPMTLYAE